MYIESRNTVVKHVRDAKIQYYDRKFDNADQKSTFKTTNSLLKRDTESLPPSDDIQQTCDDFSSYFRDKIDNILDTISSKCVYIPQLSNDATPVLLSSRLTTFTPAIEAEVERVILAAPSKSCSLDVIPTWLLKKTLPAHIDVLTNIINKTLIDGVVLSSTREAVVSPLLKKTSLDPSILKNYRPVSNLSFMGKVVERLVLSRLNIHIDLNNLSEIHQSAYKQKHSTETALIKVQSDISRYLDKSKAVLLVLLDLSAAFDTINHMRLTHTLKVHFGVDGRALEWFDSYLRGRTQRVTISNLSSLPSNVVNGVPQGSVLGPVLFATYTSPLQAIIESHGVIYHKYADDLQLLIPYDPASCDSRDSAWLKMSNCITDVEHWMTHNFLQLNADKTEIINFQSRYHLQNFSSPALKIGDAFIKPQASVRNLGVMFDQHLSMNDQVTTVIKACNFHLRNISYARQYLSDKACQTAVQALVVARFDYCCSLLGNISAAQIQRLQRVQNRAARLITRTGRFEHITPVLAKLHWLPIHLRIQFRLLVYTYTCIHGLAPVYLANMLSHY